MKSSTFGLGHGDREETGTYVPTDINPFIAHPAYERLYHTIGIYAPYSLRTAVWVLWRSTRIRTVKELWDRAYGFLSLSEKTIITIVDVTTGSPISSVISRPWVLIWSGFEPPTFRSADRRLSNRANRGGGYVLLLNIVWRGIQKPSAMIPH